MDGRPIASKKEVTEYDADLSEQGTSSGLDKLLDTIPETESKIIDIKNEKVQSTLKIDEIRGNDKKLNDKKLNDINSTIPEKALPKTTMSKYSSHNYHQTVSNINTQSYCFICRSGNTHENVMDAGIVYCQDCLFRKQHFLMGRSLNCYKCEKKLGSGSGDAMSSEFEFWNGFNYCKRCVCIVMRETGMVQLE